MRLLFVIKEPYLPEAIGGGVLDIHHLVLQFLDLGHECEVIAGMAPGLNRLAHWLRRLMSGRRLLGVSDCKNSYVTHRGCEWHVAQLLKKRLAELQPDVVIAQGAGDWFLAGEAISMGYPTIIRIVSAGGVEVLRDAEKHYAATALRSPSLLLISNSTFIQAKVRDLLGLESPVIYPLIRPDDCAVSERLPEFVTFINPSTIKGLEIALQVASLLPQRKFLFAESWKLERAARHNLYSRLRNLPNVHFRPQSINMQDVYSTTSLLLMPSQCEEAFGRVIVEAGLNGIPVVASLTGGIPEAMTDGGMLLSPSDSPEKWAEAVERILTDGDMYAQLSRNALQSAGRSVLDPDTVARHFLEIAEDHKHRSTQYASITHGGQREARTLFVTP